MSLIEIEDVTFSYSSEPDVFALRDLSCSIERGSFLGIAGVSEAGKSSLCRLIAGYIPNFFDGRLSGTVRVDDLLTAETSIGELASKVGFVFENPFDQLTGASLTVMDEVVFGLENLGTPRAEIENRARRSLERVGIADLADRHPRLLSGGQSQRLALASVLAIEPEILVLDEPTSQLDPLGTEEVIEIIGEMNRSGYTIVLVSQDLDRLAMFLDRLVIIDEGRIMRDGSPRGVLMEVAATGYPLLVPEVIQIGRRLRDLGLVDAGVPVPLTVEEAVEELGPLVDRGGHSGASGNSAT